MLKKLLKDIKKGMLTDFLFK